MYGHRDEKEIYASMAIDDFALLNIEDTIYVRPVSTPAGPAFAVFAADGTFLDGNQDFVIQCQTADQVFVQGFGKTGIGDGGRSAERHEMGLATLH